MRFYNKFEEIKKYNIIIVIIIIVFVIFLISQNNHKIFTSPPSSIKPLNPILKRDVYLGFWTYGFWDDNTKSINPKKLEEIENKIGKKVAIANYYRGWQHLGQEKEIVNELNAISAHGWRPMVSTNPYLFSECPANGKTLYRTIADGDCDAYLHKVGKTLQKINKPFFFRFAWEMNVGSMEWSILYSGSTPQDFIDAWKRFHNILIEEGVKNAIWVFSPQIETPSTTDIASLYPGNNYVDWVALDGYNWGTTKSWSKWQNFHTLYYDSYIKLKRLAPNKPLMIAEVNTVDIGGNQAHWYQSMLSEEIPNIFLDVDAIVFFNEDKTKIEGVRWLIDNSSDSLKQFQKSIQNPIYKSNIK